MGIQALRHSSHSETEFRKGWLADRMGHDWQTTDGPSRCRRCGRKFGKAAGKVCPKRRKPNRWKLHLSRAWYAAKWPKDAATQRPPDGVRLQMLMAECEYAVQQSTFDRYRGRRTHGACVSLHDEQLRWKYHPAARLYRRLLKRWWALPQVPLQPQEHSRDRWAAGLTRGRNKLIKQAQTTGQHEIRVEGCLYRFYVDATIVDSRGYRVALFP